MPIIGTPDDVTRIIENAYDSLKFNEVHLLFGQGYQPRADVETNLQLFADKVMPRF